MNYLTWVAVAGTLLLTMALSSAYVKRLPISTSLVYLSVGLLLGPAALNVVRIDIRAEAVWLERVTELAVVVSLFVCGAKLRLPLSAPAWRAPVLLAGPLMILTILGVAVFTTTVFDLPLGTGLLVGALLAPTDPVLASAIAVESASDRDHMRYGLSGEAGLNDGTAFPFVVFALYLIEQQGNFGSWVADWALHRLIWAVPAGLLIGYVVGRTLGRLAVYIRSRDQDTAAPNDFLALAIIALVYALAEFMGAWGFLAVFAAGLGLRHVELRVVREFPKATVRAKRRLFAKDEHQDPIAEGSEHTSSLPPAENLVARFTAEELKEPPAAAGTLLAEVLSFGDTIERLLEVALVLMVGIALAEYWEPRAFALALFLMLVVRPLGAQLVLLPTPTTRRQRWLIGWFGVRGIGSLYYLAHALREGLPDDVAVPACAFTLSIVAISIAVHGATAQPLLNRYERSLEH